MLAIGASPTGACGSTATTRRLSATETAATPDETLGARAKRSTAGRARNGRAGTR